MVGGYYGGEVGNQGDCEDAATRRTMALTHGVGATDLMAMAAPVNTDPVGLSSESICGVCSTKSFANFATIGPETAGVKGVTKDSSWVSCRSQ